MKNKIVPFHARQGDVLIESIESLPANRKKLPREHGRVVLAHGEVTGHHHSLSAENVSLFETVDQAGVTFLEVQEAMAELTHQEHDTINIEPGVYKVTRQREYVAPDIVRNVAD
jgi:hypothetical protein